MTEKGRRFLFGVPLLMVIALVAYLDHGRGRPLFGPLMLWLLGFGALFEYVRMHGERLPGMLRVGTLILGAGILAVPFAADLGFPSTLQGVPLILLGFYSSAVFLSVLLLVRRFRTEVLPDDWSGVGLGVLGLFVTAVPLAFLSAIFSIRDGVIWVLLVVLTSKFNDIGGYLGGSQFGRHRLAPSISPKKSIEGAVFGLSFGIGIAFLFRVAFPMVEEALSPLRTLGFGILIGVTTQAGDLLESLVKRTVKVKDSGGVIPAFGGLFDLIDSLILAAPAGYTWLVGFA